MGSAAATGDRLCQMEAMDGAARCLEVLRVQNKICNCRPLEFNTRLLEVAGSVGAKVMSIIKFKLFNAKNTFTYHYLIHKDNLMKVQQILLNNDYPFLFFNKHIKTRFKKIQFS